MTNVVVTTQAELDKAVADGVERVEIRSEEGVWLEVRSSGSSRVEAWGSSRVVAWDYSRVVARGSSRVEARGSSRVEAWDYSRVVAWDSASVVAWGSASVVAWDSASVVAWGSASVEAWDSASVEAWDSASVEAWGAASVTARGAAKVNAGSRVAVHLHSGHVTLEGGVLIDHTQVDQSGPATWCEYNGVQQADGVAVVYKAVGDDWCSQRGYVYEPGTTATCDDFADTDECGGGLHFGPTPGHAAYYHEGATRFVECHIKLAELRPITGDTAKCKAPSAVCVREVDRWREPVEAAAAAESVSS